MNVGVSGNDGVVSHIIADKKVKKKELIISLKKCWNWMHSIFFLEKNIPTLVSLKSTSNSTLILGDFSFTPASMWSEIS